MFYQGLLFSQGRLDFFFSELFLKFGDPFGELFDSRLFLGRSGIHDDRKLPLRFVAATPDLIEFISQSGDDGALTFEHFLVGRDDSLNHHIFAVELRNG